MIRAGQRPNTEEIVLLTSDTQSTQRRYPMKNAQLHKKKGPNLWFQHVQ